MVALRNFVKRNAFQLRKSWRTSVARSQGVTGVFCHLLVLGAFLLYLTLPQFGLVHHEHDGGTQPHFHKEFQSAHVTTQQDHDDQAFHSHDQDHHHIAVTDHGVNPIFTHQDSTGPGHWHDYEKISGKFFTQFIPFLSNLPFQMIDLVIQQFNIPFRGIVFSSRGPPLAF
jgi:ABC-type nickel/cobalt efflux system permease component RcnA